MYSLALIYSQGSKCRGGVKCLWECELMRGPYHEFCFIYNSCGIFVRCKLCNMKVQTIQKICNFCEKIQNFPKKQVYLGPDSIVVAPIIYAITLDIYEIFHDFQREGEKIYIYFKMAFLPTIKSTCS